MRYSYVSMLSTEAYLPGVLVLHYSLQRTDPRHPFLLLITPNISASVRAVLSQHNIRCKLLERPISNPNRVERGHRWYHNYSKLHIFNQVEFDKIVFLDADMLINQNIDELFQKAHMSAVNSGGLLPEHSSWVQLNSGLIVLEPSADLFSDMLTRIGVIENGIAGGDQAFLHAYFNDWPDKKLLHLDHKYNMFHTHLDRYHQLFSYTFEDIKVLHFIGGDKPWVINQSHFSSSPPLGWKRRISVLIRKMLGASRNSAVSSMREEAYRMWARCYHEMMLEVQSTPC